tara:strand:- start:1624 stop:2499 length:876 start_codon:yes stop_codon:yes gene_type:complete
MSASRDDFGIAIRSALLQKGARQKFSLFFFIILSLVIFFLDSFENSFMKSARSLVNDGIYRLSSVATSPFTLFQYIGGKGKAHLFIYAENKKLKEELEILKKKDMSNDFLKTKNNELLKVFINEKPEDLENQSSKVLAKVLIDKQSPYLKSVIINKGTSSKIKKGMPVLDRNYLAGRIVETNYYSSRVLLLSDLNSRIPVVLNDVAVQAILSGQGDDQPILEYLPEGYNPEDGLTVFTSGKDQIFSQGVPIGITEIKDEKVKVKLFSDSNQLSFISVEITNKKKELNKQND